MEHMIRKKEESPAGFLLSEIILKVKNVRLEQTLIFLRDNKKSEPINYATVRKKQYLR